MIKHIQLNVSVKLNYIFIIWECILSLNSTCDVIKSQKRNLRNLPAGLLDLKQRKKLTVVYTAGDWLAVGCAVGRRSQELRPLKR